jgi:hypothetical protein
MTGDLGFTWRQRKNGDIDILHKGRLASTLRGNEAADFLAEASGSETIDLQPLMARITGNYKHGNERMAGEHPRNKR